MTKRDRILYDFVNLLCAIDGSPAGDLARDAIKRWNAEGGVESFDVPACPLGCTEHEVCRLLREGK